MPKWRFDAEIGRSVDPWKWILKYDGGRSQDSGLDPYNQVVKVGVGWVDLEPVLISNYWVAKWSNILLTWPTGLVATCLACLFLFVPTYSTLVFLSGFKKNYMSWDPLLLDVYGSTIVLPSVAIYGQATANRTKPGPSLRHHINSLIKT